MDPSYLKFGRDVQKIPAGHACGIGLLTGRTRRGKGGAAADSPFSRIVSMSIWVFPKVGVPPKWMVYNGAPY